MYYLVGNNTELHKILPSISSDIEDEDDLTDSLDSEDNLIDEPNSKDDLTDLCIEVGSRLSKLLSEDIGNLAAQKNKCSIDSLQEYDAKTWLRVRQKDLVTLLRYLCTITDFDLTEKPTLYFLLAKLVEQIYECRNPKLVLPVAFQHNFLTYCLTHSKQLTRFHGRTSPSGSYTYLTERLSSQASEPISYPKRLCKSVFDNEQVIGKTRTIKAENKVPMSVITSRAYISIDEKSKIQEDKAYCTSNWLFHIPTEEQSGHFLETSKIATFG